MPDSITNRACKPTVSPAPGGAADRTAAAQAAKLPPPANVRTGPRYLGLIDISVLLASMLVFLVFLFGLGRVVFPDGSSLAALGTARSSTDGATGERGEINLAGGGIEKFGAFVATLADVSREVKIRSANSIVWSDAPVGVAVNNRDAIQTFAGSRARVDFTSDNELRIGQNSLVIFQSGASDPFLQRRDAAVVVMEGELTGVVGADYGALAVQLPAGLVILKAESESGDKVDFKVNINADNSSTISVYSGEANINVAGEHYRVVANAGLTINEDGYTAGTRVLPATPDTQQPLGDAVATYRELPPRVNFAWNDVDDAQSYRLEIAKDPHFERILVDETLTRQSFTHGNLAAGDYFWRVSARSGWVQGPASAPRRLQVLQDMVPPVLELEPVQATAAGSYRLRGKTSRDAAVFVSGREIEITDGGTFDHLFSAQPGAQALVVEAVDAVGNVAYSSQVLHAQNFSGRGR